MSIEVHPNINAAGLAAAVMDALVKYGRGGATGPKALTPEVLNATQQFCVAVSVILDREYGKGQ
jgi:hypothetical protein